MDSSADTPPTVEHDGVTVTVVSATWRAAIVEVRTAEEVRWLTVPRRQLDGFLAAAATGAIGMLLRNVLGASGSHVPTDVESDFGVFDHTPPEYLLLSPERHPATGTYRPGSSKDDRRHADRPPRHRSPTTWLVLAAGAAVVTTVGLVALNSSDDPSPSAIVPITADPSATTSSVPAASVPSTLAPTTTPQSTGPETAVFPTQDASSVQFTDFTGTFEGGPSDAQLDLSVECSSRDQCVLILDESLSITRYPLVDDAVVGQSSVAPKPVTTCPPEWEVTTIVDLAFEFDPTSPAPVRVVGTVTLDQPLLRSGNTVCFGRHAEWTIDATRT